ncbi:hypothetical protein ACVW0P_001510 [Mucilaginibacter sp. UYNi724]
MESNNTAKGLKAEVLTALSKSENYLVNLGVFDTNPNIINREGQVTYLNLTTNPLPPNLVETQRKVNVLLEGLVGVVVAAVIKVAGNDEEKAVDAATWNYVMERVIPSFFNFYNNSKEYYDKDVIGREVASNFINFITSNVVASGPELSGFERFLRSQGESIKIQAGKDGPGYKYAVVSIVHEIIEKGQDFVYTPKIRLYFTSFTRDNYKICSSCQSFDRVIMKFEMNAITAEFKINDWINDKEFRSTMENFVNKYTKADISESENYFNGVFTSQL